VAEMISKHVPGGVSVPESSGSFKDGGELSEGSC